MQAVHLAAQTGAGLVLLRPAGLHPAGWCRWCGRLGLRSTSAVQVRYMGGTQKIHVQCVCRSRGVHLQLTSHRDMLLAGPLGAYILGGVDRDRIQDTTDI
jgi:hypothetical protein